MLTLSWAGGWSLVESKQRKQNWYLLPFHEACSILKSRSKDCLEWSQDKVAMMESGNLLPNSMWAYLALHNKGSCELIGSYFKMRHYICKIISLIFYFLVDNRVSLKYMLNNIETTKVSRCSIYEEK
jgi:hypothetical protein